MGGSPAASKASYDRSGSGREKRREALRNYVQTSIVAIRLAPVP